MSRTESKQKKKLVVPFLIRVALTIICVGLLSFVSDKDKEDTSSKIYFLLSTLLLAYILYHPVKKLLKNEPILVFDDESITHYNPKPVTIPKDQIEQYLSQKAREKGLSLEAYVLKLLKDTILEQDKLENLRSNLLTQNQLYLI